jgi:hypothetical protein
MDLETPIPEPSERRTDPREPVDVPATLMMIQQGITFTGSLADLGLGGCCVRIDRDCRFHLHSTAEVIFRLNGIAFRLFGYAQWIDGKRMIGIRFGQMPDRRRAELAEVIEELASARAAKATIDPAAQSFTVDSTTSRIPARAAAEVAPGIPPKTPSETWPLNDSPPTRRVPNPFGLRVLERASPVPVLPDPQPVVPKSPPPAPAAPLSAAAAPSNKRDRRVEARHSVDSSATIFLIDILARSTGRILDVSVSGCRIHTDERFPVGIYRRVEVEFTLDGLPFRLPGVTQALHNRNTVGVRFLNLSPRKLEQLTMLIAEIDEVHKNNQDAAQAEPAPPV